jgi:hypothetical protein
VLSTGWSSGMVHLLSCDLGMDTYRNGYRLRNPVST